MTEHTISNPPTADMGVLFLTATSFSTMCGHVTIALGRFLIDCHDLEIFPRRNDLKTDPETQTVEVRVHTPCGVMHLVVPTTENGSKSDPSRRVHFLSTPSYAVDIDRTISIPQDLRWPELAGRAEVTLDFAFGGTFYALVSCDQIGWTGGLRNLNIDRLNDITKTIKRLINADKALCNKIFQSAVEDLRFVYGGKSSSIILPLDRHVAP